MDLKSKTVLLTGGSEGLGLSIAKKLIEAGSVVHITGRTEETLEKAKEEINSPSLYTHQVDASDYTQTKNLVEEIGDIDVLINNAGMWIEGPLESYDPTYISKVIDVNTKGVIYNTLAVLPQMKQRDSGYILNVISTSGITPKENQSVYVASKFAISGFTDSLKEELKPTNVKIAGFYPGGMNTRLFEKGNSPKDISKWMDTDKVAEVIIFMLTRDISMTMGHVVLTKNAK